MARIDPERRTIGDAAIVQQRLLRACELAYANLHHGRTRDCRPDPSQALLRVGGRCPGEAEDSVTALALFVRDGLCETSVRDIAKASGFTNPALFKHFRSKDDLARYLFERCYLELQELVSPTRSRRGHVCPEAARGHRGVSGRARSRRGQRPVCPGRAAPFLAADARPSPATFRSSATCAGSSSGAALKARVTDDIDIELLTTAWLGTLQQFARFRYFGEFKQPTRAWRTDSTVC